MLELLKYAKEAGLTPGDIQVLVAKEEERYKQERERYKQEREEERYKREREERREERELRKLELANAEADKERAEAEKQRAEAEKQRAEAEKQREHELEVARLNQESRQSRSQVQEPIPGLKLPKFLEGKDEIDDFL